MALMDSPDYEKAIAEIYRVLRKNGDFFFSISHPCFMTQGFGWVTDRQGNQEKLTVSGYFSKTQWVERWQFSQCSGRNKKDVPQFAIPSFPTDSGGIYQSSRRRRLYLEKIGGAAPFCQRLP